MGLLMWNVKDIVEICRQWQENKFDGLIAVSGNRGLGKSTFAFKLASRFQQFKPNSDLVFAREEVMKILAEKKHGVIVADEMINVTYNRDFYSEDQKKILKMLNMYRDSCNILIMCIPNFYHLDSQLRTLCKLRIDVVRRGLAVVHTRKQGSYLSDPWELKINEKIETGWFKKNVFKPRYSKLTTYRAMLKFGDLGVRQRELYEKLKQEKRNVVFELTDDKEKKKESIYERTLLKIKEGIIKREDLPKICAVNKIKWDNLLNHMNRLLKAEGETRTVQQILKNGYHKVEKVYPITLNEKKLENSSRIPVI